MSSRPYLITGPVISLKLAQDLQNLLTRNDRFSKQRKEMECTYCIFVQNKSCNLSRPSHDISTGGMHSLNLYVGRRVLYIQERLTDRVIERKSGIHEVGLPRAKKISLIRLLNLVKNEFYRTNLTFLLSPISLQSIRYSRKLKIDSPKEEIILRMYNNTDDADECHLCTRRRTRH